MTVSPMARRGVAAAGSVQEEGEGVGAEADDDRWGAPHNMDYPPARWP